MTLTTLIVRHQVEDYAAWREEYDAVEPLRLQHGCVGQEVMVSPSDDNDVTVLHRFPTLDQAQGFAASDDLHAAMAHGHVIGAPRVEFALEK
ncbi:MAG: cyclase [Acidimicrobiales bacterium]